MTHHSGEQLWKEGVAQDGYESEHEKKGKVKQEKNVGNDVEPVCVVRKLMQHDRYNAGRHGNDEPSDQDMILLADQW